MGYGYQKYSFVPYKSAERIKLKKGKILNVVAIVQARMSSKRLPNKVLMDVNGRPLLARVIDRVFKAKTISKVVVATSDSPEDDLIEEYCMVIGVDCFRGALDDVLCRFYKCAILNEAKVIVRITADDPFKCPVLIDAMVSKLISGNLDYISNTHKVTFPEGLDAEVFTFESLSLVNRFARLPSEREHVTPYYKNNHNFFRSEQILSAEDLSEWRLTVDNASDLETANMIYRTAGEDFSTEDLIACIRSNYIDRVVNTGFARNEAYLKDVENETHYSDQ